MQGDIYKLWFQSEPKCPKFIQNLKFLITELKDEVWIEIKIREWTPMENQTSDETNFHSFVLRCEKIEICGDVL